MTGVTGAKPKLNHASAPFNAEGGALIVSSLQSQQLAIKLPPARTIGKVSPVPPHTRPEISTAQGVVSKTAGGFEN
jgi:hypothetical protein